MGVMDVLIGLTAALLIGICIIHIYWACGGFWGSKIVLPTIEAQQPVFVPGKLAALTVAFLVLSAAVLLILQWELFTIVHPIFLVKWGCWICVGAFSLRVVGDFKYFGLFKKVRNSRFSKYDTYLYTPLCAWFSLIFYVAIQSGG